MIAGGESPIGLASLVNMPRAALALGEAVRQRRVVELTEESIRRTPHAARRGPRRRRRRTPATPCKGKPCVVSCCLALG